jgi:TPP-dependent pyruvate/acetoin dehydrogenase alpha subunit
MRCTATRDASPETSPSGDARPRCRRASRICRPGAACHPADVAEIRAVVTRDLEAAVDFSEKSPYPDPNDLLVDMFAE